MTSTSLTIFAPDATIRAWREESARLADVARYAGLHPVVREALHHAAGILLASAVNATPGAPEVMVAGLSGLVKEVIAEQERAIAAARSGGTPSTCPMVMDAGGPFACGCSPTARLACAALAGDAATLDADLERVAGGDRAGRVAGDDGREGGTA